APRAERQRAPAGVERRTVGDAPKCAQDCVEGLPAWGEGRPKCTSAGVGGAVPLKCGQSAERSNRSALSSDERFDVRENPRAADNSLYYAGRYGFGARDVTGFVPRSAGDRGGFGAGPVRARR